MGKAKPPTSPRTLDEITGENIRRLREEREWSRVELASRMSNITGSEVSRWLVIDLEGARSQGQAPRAATWPELVSLSLAFEVSIYELVLPSDDETRVITAASIPKTDESVRPDGGRKTLSVRYTHSSSRDEMGKLLFGLPGSSLTAERLEKIADNYPNDLEDALEGIRNTQQGLERALETLGLLAQARGDEKEDH